MPYFVRIAAAAALILAAQPAFAQQFSESYEFLEAVKKGDGAKVMKYLNEPGTRIIDSKERDSGDAALHIVTKRSDEVYLRFLLQRDANPNIKDARGNTPLMLATNISFIEGVRILLTYKANINIGNSSGETPLIRAVQLRDLEMVQLLLANGADPDQADLLAGMSARDYAKQDRRSPAIAKLLAEAPKIQRKAAVGPNL
ncbi:ankyrin repeat domain-containing protein [Sphingomonas canadensis]|uniref:Ankyrin repeat domain-containing protein n=1 Tax=Sphingomonas canadensis TaxID=1219257 RepID=A0ABW3H4E8_9SPHN|nr:ankyrin repeat domain-containing protein [Sphingomonas canadensis]MCW3834880.1 ankyrin repeat domain-containing protein [Sphingomonas canadensis]